MYCQHSFDSMFGPPHAKCPNCRSDDVRDANTGWGPPPDSREQACRGSAFSAPQRDTAAPPESVPSDVLDITPWLVASVALTLFCQPVGIVGIYFCDRAKHLARQGQIEQAREKLTWSMFAAVGGWILVFVIAAVITLAVVLGG
jgi:hypothetical protein